MKKIRKIDCGLLLRVTRIDANLTQAEAAANYGIEERTLRRWENGEYKAKWIDVVSLIQDVYQKNLIDTLVSFTEQQS